MKKLAFCMVVLAMGMVTFAGCSGDTKEDTPKTDVTTPDTDTDTDTDTDADTGDAAPTTE